MKFGKVEKKIVCEVVKLDSFWYLNFNSGNCVLSVIFVLKL